MKRVLIVDDSPAACELLKKLINSFEGYKVCGVASDAFNARDLIQSIKPDLITLDVQMPKMDGITFLNSLMRNKPLPTLMVSSMTTDGAVKTLEALDVGAIDYIPKPKLENEEQLKEFTETLRQKLNHVAHIPNAFLQSKANQLRTGKVGLTKKKMPANIKTAFYNQIIAIGAGSGGTDAIRQILEDLTPDVPGIVIAQQLPANYIESFANRLTETTGFQTKVASDGEIIMPGQIYICRPDCKVTIKNDGTKLSLAVTPYTDPSNNNPMNDLFNSIANNVQALKVATLLTGTGNDGVKGAKAIKESGGTVIGQDKESSVIWNVIEQANEEGYVDQIIPLKKISTYINETFKG